MKPQRSGLATVSIAVVLAGGALMSGQSVPNEPRRGSGSSVTGAFEGWFNNPDGNYRFLVGYMNRNQTQELDIPVGPNNKMEPGAIDRGQPTHFMPGRQWGMFVVEVPRNLGQQKITWTIVANGQTTSIPFYAHTDYEISPFVEAAVGNTPPVLSFDENGRSVQGPLLMTTERTTRLADALDVTVWVSDDVKFTSNSGVRPRNLTTPVGVTWTKYRGPGTVKFDKEKPEIQKLEGGKAAFSGKATTTVTFGQAGDYMLQVTANDFSGVGGGGFQCCWTTGLVKVSVTP